MLDRAFWNEIGFFPFSVCSLKNNGTSFHSYTVCRNRTAAVLLRTPGLPAAWVPVRKEIIASALPSKRSYQRYERKPEAVDRRVAAPEAWQCIRKIPHRWEKEGYCGKGMGSFVNCRHLLSVSRRPARALLHIPVPGASCRVVLPPDKTAHFRTCSKKVRFWHRINLGAQGGG